MEPYIIAQYMALSSMPGFVLDAAYDGDASPQRLSSHATCSNPPEANP